ncbi:MAG: hypothetical protein ACTSQY_03200 [Candidatus Odinarchaeia archaeon]
MKESELLKVWLWNKHREDVQWRRVRLGVVPGKQEAKMYSVLLRWADAIILKDGKVLIVEAKLRPDPKVTGQLELYEKLFRVTPEFKYYWSWPIRKVLLTSIMDLEMLAFVTEKNIDYELFTEEEVKKGFNPSK